MSANTIHPMGVDYLKRLRRAGRRLPRARLRELLVEIEGHLSEAIEPEAPDAEALTVLDRLGEPEEIVNAEQPRQEVPADTRGTQEWAAIILLLFGGFIFGAGWLAGLVLLWSSRAWTTRDKWIGTLVIPGGLATVFYGMAILGVAGGQSCTSEVVRVYPASVGRAVSGGVQHCSGGASTATVVLLIVGLVILVLAPIASAVYLARRAR